MIQLYQVSKTYAGGGLALNDVSLSIEKGEFVFLTGASGAGKSTLLRLLLGAEMPSSGQVLLSGQNVARLTRTTSALLRRRIGVVFQDFKLLTNRTIFENIALPLEVSGVSRRDAGMKVAVLLRHIGLAEKAGHYPQRLSGGEQQRVAIARALAADPEILLADEPTGNLDAERAADIVRLLNEANARGTTVVIATHDQQLISNQHKRTIVLKAGHIEKDGFLSASDVAHAMKLDLIPPSV